MIKKLTSKNEVKLSHPLIFSGLISIFCYTNGFVSLNKMIFSTTSISGITVAKIVGSLLVIIGNHILINKVKRYLYFRVFLISEVLAYTILFTYIIIYDDVSVYLLIDAILYNTITNGICIHQTTLINDIFVGEARLQYDLYNMQYKSIITLIAFISILVVKLPLKISYLMVYIGIVVDNIFIYYTYDNFIKNKIE